MPAASQPIDLPPQDPFMKIFTADGNISTAGSRTAIPFKRSKFEIDGTGVRQQINSVTSLLDASCVYGSSEATAKALRLGTGGLLKDDRNKGLPFNEDVDSSGVAPRPKLVNVSNEARVVPNTRLRAAGLGNVNQHPGLLAIATIWLREHNRRAAEAVQKNPTFGDEEAFEYARKWVMAHHTHVIYDEYLPVLLGNILPPYSGYNATANPGMDNFFSTAAYRYGHSTVTDVVYRLDEKWQEHPQGHLLLSNVWFQPDKALSAGIEPIIRGYIASTRGMVEPRFSAAVQQNLFGPAITNGSDLFALNIQRGRDHGLPDYNTCRRMLGLAPVTSFRNITPDADLAAKLEKLYAGNVNNIDAYVGGLAEPHYGNAHVGELFYRSIFDQFWRLRDGDWWYYKNADNGLFTAKDIQEVDTTSLRQIILRNTNITELPDNIWTLSEEALLGVCPVGTTAAAAGSAASLSAAAGAGGASNESTTAGPFKLLGGAIELTFSRTTDPGRIRVQQVAYDQQGYMGFGVSRAGQEVGMKMVGADIVISRMLNSQPSVQDYHATAPHMPPVLDSNSGGSDDVTLISYERGPVQTVSVFERPLGATNGNGLDNPILLEGPNTFIVSLGQDDSLTYHGIDHRAALELQGPLFGGDHSTATESVAADPVALQRRYQHGILMAVNFILVFPLGALMARQLRARWLSSLAFKAVLFYLHITTQMCGIALATAGFIIAKSQFGVPYQQVPLSHGVLGVTVLSLVYAQLLIGFVRPPAAQGTLRSMWQLFHALFGRAALILGIVNVFIGIYLLNTLYRGNIALWGGLCAAGLGCIALMQSVGDLLERRASEALAAQIDATPQFKPGSAHSKGIGDQSNISRIHSDVLSEDIPPADPYQFKPYRPGLTAAGMPAGHVYDGFGGHFVGISPVGGSGMGRGLHWGPSPGQEQYGSTASPPGQYNEQYRSPVQQGTGTDEEGGTAHAGHDSDSSRLPGTHGPAAVLTPIAKSVSALGNTLGAVGTMLKRTTSREPPPPPQLKWSPQSMASDVFCDYETAGVYDPTSGDFKAAHRSKKSPVQDIRLPPGLDQGLGLPGAGFTPLNRRQSSSSDTSLASGTGTNRSRGPSPGPPANWKSAATAAAAANAMQQAAAAGSKILGSPGSKIPVPMEVPTAGAAAAGHAYAPADAAASGSTGSFEELPRLSSNLLRAHNAAPARPGATASAMQQQNTMPQQQQQQQQLIPEHASGEDWCDEEAEDGLGPMNMTRFGSPRQPM